MQPDTILNLNAENTVADVLAKGRGAPTLTLASIEADKSKAGK